MNIYYLTLIFLFLISKCKGLENDEIESIHSIPIYYPNSDLFWLDSSNENVNYFQSESLPIQYHSEDLISDDHHLLDDYYSHQPGDDLNININNPTHNTTNETFSQQYQQQNAILSNDQQIQNNEIEAMKIDKFPSNNNNFEEYLSAMTNETILNNMADEINFKIKTGNVSELKRSSVAGETDTKDTHNLNINNG
jgi:hypothetical protein